METLRSFKVAVCSLAFLSATACTAVEQSPERDTTDHPKTTSTSTAPSPSNLPPTGIGDPEIAEETHDGYTTYTGGLGEGYYSVVSKHQDHKIAKNIFLACMPVGAPEMQITITDNQVTVFESPTYLFPEATKEICSHGGNIKEFLIRHPAAAGDILLDKLRSKDDVNDALEIVE